MIDWLFGGNSCNDEPEDDSKIEDLSDPEFWKNLGIKPIVVDQNDPDYLEKLGDEVCKRIEEAVEEMKRSEK